MRKIILQAAMSLLALSTIASAGEPDYIAALFRTPSEPVVIDAPAAALKTVPQDLVMKVRRETLRVRPGRVAPVRYARRVEPVANPPVPQPNPLFYSAPFRDPLAVALFMSSAAVYLPPTAVCQEGSFDTPTCNYQRPYLVFDQINGGAFDIAPDYMKYVDPRYNWAMRYGG